jgi:hypothetical protein
LLNISMNNTAVISDITPCKAHPSRNTVTFQSWHTIQPFHHQRFNVKTAYKVVIVSY